ncbi:MAG: succinyl-diaminopimelate desuccinylase, partial [Gammaproteobacteria bacterium]
VGEPTSKEKIGDAIRTGRRGSLTGTLKVKGVHGHVAYPEFAKNPIHLLSPALTKLCSTTWDNGNDHYPPTSFQISNINAGTGADNVIPGRIDVLFNFRYSTEVTHEDLRQQVESILDEHGLDYEIEWRLSGEPFITTDGQLLDIVRDIIKKVTNNDTEVSTRGGTSDGRFIAPTGAQVIELGPANATIHKVNECVRIEDLDTLSTLYEKILQRLLI